MTTKKYTTGDLLRCVDDMDSDPWLLEGCTYRVIRCNQKPEYLLEIEDGNGNAVIGEWRQDRFELVQSAALTMEEQFKLAKSLVGKHVQCSTNGGWAGTFLVTQVLIYTESYQIDNSSALVQEEFGKIGWVVLVFGEDREVPVNQVTEYSQVTVKLNDSYEAVIDSNYVRVGCQTFPHSIIKEIQSAIDQMAPKDTKQTNI